MALIGPRVLRKLKTSLALPAALLFLVACGYDEPGPIMLGAAGPWREGYGAMNKRGIELALEHLNARSEHKTRPVEVVFRDDQGDGARAAAIAQEFVENPTVVGVIGHVNSGAMVAAAKVYDGHLPAVATTATSPELTGISPWAFRVISSDSANGLQLARFAAKLGRRRVAILYENNSYGRGLTESFTRHFTGDVVSIDPIGDAGDQTFEPFVSYYRRVRPDLVFVAGTEASGITLLREVRRQGLDVDLLGGDGWTGVSVDTANAEGVWVGTPFTAEDPRSDARRFVDAFKAKFGYSPDGNAALAYDATMLLVHAVQTVGADRAKVRRFLAAAGPRNAYRGVTGTIRFNPNGDPVAKSFVMTRIRRGALVVDAGR
ncbi:MAG: ABC transporter substrate-binding protein [Gemmatimonadota bacterium]|nr:ABC transporter substrate-binding protein [Gemmatimonadota bacterium]